MPKYHTHTNPDTNEQTFDLTPYQTDRIRHLFGYAHTETLRDRLDDEDKDALMLYIIQNIPDLPELTRHRPRILRLIRHNANIVLNTVYALGRIAGRREAHQDHPIIAADIISQLSENPSPTILRLLRQSMTTQPQQGDLQCNEHDNAPNADK